MINPKEIIGNCISQKNSKRNQLEETFDKTAVILREVG